MMYLECGTGFIGRDSDSRLVQMPTQITNAGGVPYASFLSSLNFRGHLVTSSCFERGQYLSFKLAKRDSEKNIE